MPFSVATISPVQPLTVKRVALDFCPVAASATRARTPAIGTGTARSRVNTPGLVGPLSIARHGADISSIVGLLVALRIYTAGG